MQFQQLIGRGSSVVLTRKTRSRPSRGETMRLVLPGALSSCLSSFDFCRNTLSSFFYSHISCNLLGYSERYLLQTPLVISLRPLQGIRSRFAFLLQSPPSSAGYSQGRVDLLSQFPACRLNCVYCICPSWSVIGLPLAERCQLQSPFEDAFPYPNRSLTLPPFDIFSTIPLPTPKPSWRLMVTTQSGHNNTSSLAK